MFLPNTPIHDNNNYQVYYLPDVLAVQLLVEKMPRLKVFFESLLDKNDPNVKLYWEHFVDTLGEPYILIDNNGATYMFQYPNEDNFNAVSEDSDIINQHDFEHILYDADTSLQQLSELTKNTQQWNQISPFFTV